jgi:hypothetical protein
VVDIVSVMSPHQCVMVVGVGGRRVADRSVLHKSSITLANQRAYIPADRDVAAEHPCKSGVARKRRAWTNANWSLPSSLWLTSS